MSDLVTASISVTICTNEMTDPSNIAKLLADLDNIVSQNGTAGSKSSTMIETTEGNTALQIAVNYTRRCDAIHLADLRQMMLEWAQEAGADHNEICAKIKLEFPLVEE